MYQSPLLSCRSERGPSPLNRALVFAALFCLMTMDVFASPHPPGGHLPLAFGGDNQQSYPALSPVDVSPLPSPTREMHLAVSPNPFSHLATLSITSMPARTGRIEIFDVSGRLVRHLSVADPINGAATVVWDGRGASGAPMRDGIYLVRVTSGARSRINRLVLLR